MRLHRFYIDPETHVLERSFWLRDDALIAQWSRVLRYAPGDEVVLFDGVTHERLYRIEAFEPGGVKLELVTEFERMVPARHTYLFWALLKKDKNDWVVQKGTELGITNFVPLVAGRSEKTGFNEDRARKIAIEAAEQSGRSDIPAFREPQTLDAILHEYKDSLHLYICDERTDPSEIQEGDGPAGLLIGPEGGWTEQETRLAIEAGATGLHLGPLTLRAETAVVVAAAQLLSKQ
jgi:16S rRNA (uracil1498-N3)-methyltransferase